MANTGLILGAPAYAAFSEMANLLYHRPQEENWRKNHSRLLYRNFS